MNIPKKKFVKKELIYKISGITGILGCLGVVAGDIVGIMVHEAHNPIGNTISMLAIGKYGWIQDVGLDLLAFGFVGLAFGLFAWKSSGTKWFFGLLILVLLALDIILIAEHNQYAGRPGNTIHRKLVYALALLFPALLVLMSFDLKHLKPYLKNLSRWFAGIWLVLAPLMPLIPTTIEGAYERAVSSLIVIWLGLVSYHLYRLPQRKS